MAHRGHVCIFIFIVSIWVIVHISIPYSEFKLTSYTVASYNPDRFLLFSPCGTKFHTESQVQDTRQKEERWINLRTIEVCRLDGLTVHRIILNARAIKSGVITAVISSHGMHPKHRIAIERRRSNAFYNASQRPHPDAPSTIWRLRHFSNGPQWTVSS